jgi:hypothetical protein
LRFLSGGFTSQQSIELSGQRNLLDWFRSRKRVPSDHHACVDADAPTVKEWRSDRSISYGRIELKKDEEKKIETEMIRGVKVKHYN